MSENFEQALRVLRDQAERLDDLGERAAADECTALGVLIDEDRRRRRGLRPYSRLRFSRAVLGPRVEDARRGRAAGRRGASATGGGPDGLRPVGGLGRFPRAGVVRDRRGRTVRRRGVADSEGDVLDVDTIVRVVLTLGEWPVRSVPPLSGPVRELAG